MKTLKLEKSIVVLHNKKKGNNYKVANILKNHFNCDIIAAEDNPSLTKYDIIIFVVSNVGDEELCQPMEDYIYRIKLKNKSFLVCELGNYFGLEEYVGCKKIVKKLLEKLKWKKISDISLDSLPVLDLESLEEWICKISNLLFI